MNKADIACPHRLLINQSLRKEAEKLRIHIDEYKERYDAHYQKNIEELESVRDQLNSEYGQTEKAIIDALSSDVEVMQEISDAIAAYVSAYFDRRLAYKKKEINTVQTKLVEEYIGFLSEQMSELGSEIDILRSRIEILTRKADVADILHLVKLSGNVFQVEEINDARELLERIKSQMDSAYENDSIAWYSLFNLRAILEERTSFLAEIQYISWIIEQKIQLSKELKSSREEQYKLQSDLTMEAERLQSEIADLSSILLNRAKEIRFFWARRIVFVGAEIEDNYTRINRLKEDTAEFSEKRKSLYHAKEAVQQDIDKMKDEHSSDSFRWDRLQREKRDLSEEIRNLKSRIDSSNSEIESLKAAIDLLKAKRSDWNTKRKAIQDLLWKHSVPLVRIANSNQSDDNTFADVRLGELLLIEGEGREAAKKEYQLKLQKLHVERECVVREREEAVSQISLRLESANKALQIAEANLGAEKQSALTIANAKVNDLEQQLAEQKTALVSSQKKLKYIQTNDTRFVLFRWFSDTPEETEAKAIVVSQRKKVKEIETALISARQKLTSDSFADVSAVAEAQKEVDNALAEVREITTEKEAIQKPFGARISDLETQIMTLKPSPTRPTAEERSEMRKIKIWKTSQEKRASSRKEKNDERKD